MQVSWRGVNRMVLKGLPCAAEERDAAAEQRSLQRNAPNGAVDQVTMNTSFR